MTATEQIVKLEELLARVQSRSRVPGLVSPASVAMRSHAPAPPTELEPASYVEGADDLGAELEVSTEMVEIDIDVDEEGLEEAYASEAAEGEAYAGEATEGEAYAGEATEGAWAEDATARTPAPPGGQLELEEVHEEPEPEEARLSHPANEIEEPAPSSSPRPIVEPRLEEEPAPRHTPPPESGKQVAASSYPPARPSSIPPASGEGHTLIGGWREPGLGPAGGFQLGSPGGVRVPAPPPGLRSPVSNPPPGFGGAPAAPAPPLGSSSLPPALPSLPPALSSLPPALSSVSPAPPLGVPVVGASGPIGDFTGPKPARRPEVTRPELPASAQVASFEGAPASFAPATFGELLDATLDL